uniref:ATP-binding protein n=1 Tax=Listeria monocytogenes TaxID=1639 RepID=UPI00277D0CD9
YSVLIIDEVGYLPFSKEGSNLLFQLINMRYERKSTIVTTNIPRVSKFRIGRDKVVFFLDLP